LVCEALLRVRADLEAVAARLAAGLRAFVEVVLFSAIAMGTIVSCVCL
jgi:hypothetical protein